MPKLVPFDEGNFVASDDMESSTDHGGPRSHLENALGNWEQNRPQAILVDISLILQSMRFLLHGGSFMSHDHLTIPGSANGDGINGDGPIMRNRLQIGQRWRRSVRARL